MSLVSEALRKARAQQLRQAAEQGQLPPPVAPAPPRQRGLPLLLLVSVFSGLGGAATVAFLWSRWLGSAPTLPAPAPPATAATPLAATTQQPAPLPTPVQPSPGPVQPQAAVPPLLKTPARAEGDVPSVTPVAPTPSPEAMAPKEFVLRAQLPEAELTLDFLVYGGAKSFARINGQDVMVGDLVAGFTVETIQEDRVVLRGPTGTVVLKLR